jgi:hypothetical protein
MAGQNQKKLFGVVQQERPIILFRNDSVSPMKKLFNMTRFQFIVFALLALERLLHHARLKAIQWINLNRHLVEFTTLRS